MRNWKNFSLASISDSCSSIVLKNSIPGHTKYQDQEAFNDDTAGKIDQDEDGVKVEEGAQLVLETVMISGSKVKPHFDSTKPM